MEGCAPLRPLIVPRALARRDLVGHGGNAPALRELQMRVRVLHARVCAGQASVAQLHAQTPCAMPRNFLCASRRTVAARQCAELPAQSPQAARESRCTRAVQVRDVQCNNPWCIQGTC